MTKDYFTKRIELFCVMKYQFLFNMKRLKPFWSEQDEMNKYLDTKMYSK